MIYFDNNATTPVAPAVSAVMSEVLRDCFGNPSSAHAAGRRAREAVEKARAQTAALVGARAAAEIVFTSGGTESDNWAILGALEMNPAKKHVVTTRVEHEAVRRLGEKLERKGYEVTWLDVDPDGALDPDALEAALRPETAIVSVMLANNETGILFPVAEIAARVKARSDALFHTDAVNAAGKIPLAVAAAEIDLLSLSGHKFHAPKGVGALYIREGLDFPPLAVGGGQERGRRAGTEAVHQIAALGAAAELAADLAPMARVRRLRDRLENEILQKIPNSRLNGTNDPARRLPNTSSISFAHTNGEAILARLDDAGVCVSTGSACNAENHTASAVLQAMNIPYADAMGAIRFSLGRENTEEEVERVLAVLPAIVEERHAV